MAYNLAVPRVDTALGQLRVDYALPELLAGEGQRISLRGALDATGRTATITGGAGSARCEVTPQEGVVLRCIENLPGAHVDLAAVERAAHAAGVSDVAAYLAVAAWFASEPIGVLEVR